MILSLTSLIEAFLADAQLSRTDNPHTVYDKMVRDYAREGRVDVAKQIRAAHGEVKSELWRQLSVRGSLWQRYSPSSAPSPGQRGYRPPAEIVERDGYDGWGGDLAGLSRRLLAAAWSQLEQPNFAALYGLATDDLFDEYDREQAWLNIADIICFPSTDHACRTLTPQGRSQGAQLVVELAMDSYAPFAGRDMPREMLQAIFSDNWRYELRGEQPRCEDGRRPPATGVGELPEWLAEAILYDRLDRGARLRLVPVSREEATSFISRHHSQLPEFPYRTMYAVGAAYGDRLVAVATAGHPSGPWKPVKSAEDYYKRARAMLNYVRRRDEARRRKELPADLSEAERTRSLKDARWHGLGLAQKEWMKVLAPLKVAAQQRGRDGVDAFVADLAGEQPAEVEAEILGRLRSYEVQGIDQRNVLELTRVASDGTIRNAASMLTARILDLLPVSGRGDPSEPPLFVTYQLTAEEGSTYRALAERGLRPVLFRDGSKHKGGGGSRENVKALADVDKILWQAGPLATWPDWDLLNLNPGDKPKYGRIAGKGVRR